MKTINLKTLLLSKVLVIILLIASPNFVNAQRMSRGSGGARPSGGGAGAMQNRSANQGSIRQQPEARSNFNNNAKPERNATPSKVDKKTPSKDQNSRSNNNNSGNKINVDNSHNNNNNINVNVNNSKHVNVRNNTRPYNRPPYRYGGNRYYCYHPYSYHPYHPYYWGPMWHPWGFFITAIAVTAIVVSVENQQYYYDQGIYYVSSNGGYTVVQAPPGATITTLPTGAQTVTVNETTNNYYYGGTYYEKTGSDYTVVAPTAGTIVENLPDGGEEVKIGDVTYVKVGDTYYQPIDQDGKSMYEVVKIEADTDSDSK